MEVNKPKASVVFQGEDRANDPFDGVHGNYRELLQNEDFEEATSGIEMVDINIDDFSEANEFSSDVYLKLKNGKFLKIFLQASVVDQQRVKKYVEIGGEKIFCIRCEDYLAFYGHDHYVPISVTLLDVGALIPVDLFLKRENNEYQQFLSASQIFSAEHSDILSSRKIDTIHILKSEEKVYFDYAASRLSGFFSNKKNSEKQKADLLINSGTQTLEKSISVFTNESIGQVNKLSENVTSFVNNIEVTKIHDLLNIHQDETIYQHSLNVSVFASVMLEGIFECRRKSSLKKYVKIFDKAIDETQETHDVLLVASLLHDLGKTLLSGESDMNVIFKHPDVGAKKILEISDSPLHQKVAEVVLQHEEFADGTGHPCRLKRANMSILSQIVSLANYYENCIQKHKGDNNKAIEEIQNCESRFNKYLIAILVLALYK
ncbi:MAG: HD domain-containing protein [Oligoflexia bacterium]|nr:HD domain-containing protein [Oligoflexia bacterium]